MKKMIFTLVFLGISLGIQAQWNPNGNNSTTGSVFAENLIINRGGINSTDLDSKNKIGVYRVSHPGYSSALLDVSGIGGSTPRFQLKARYNDKLYYRAARDSEENWDGKGFREILTADENGGINFEGRALSANTVTADNILVNRGGINSTDLDSKNKIGVYRVSHPGYSSALLDISGIGGSTPRFQLKARYNDKLYYRAARDSEENWDGKGFREILTADEKGNVGIGVADTKGFKLGVKGRVVAEEVKVAVYSQWADFVFDKDYDLPTLTEVEDHIEKEGHLQGIPSAEEVKGNGVYLGEMDAKLLQKIEELTLYLIAQEKKIKALEAQNEKFLEWQSRLEKEGNCPRSDR